ncbi:MAG TPA: glycoside hydrolase family 3 N-terminal domain-containing protein [Dehalococcoidia bacterium]|nr:glycoside hydrolase family 3 N-terminal domain-containing protein [Dehalococcoidia bacterium]
MALLLCGVFLNAPTAAARPVPQTDGLVDKLLASLTPQQKIEQLFIAGFQGAEVTPELRQFIDAHQLGGVFLSRESCNIDNGTAYDPEHCGFPDDADPDTPAQIAALTNELQKASCEATTGSVDGTPYCLPLFVSIDHEGDDRPSTRLLNRFTPIPSNMAIGATFDPSQAEKVGCIVGRELSAVGVNMLFGPDLDVLDAPRSGGAGDQGIRVFGGDARWVGEMGAAYVRGIQECGGGRLATVVKHFPGHGRSNRSVDYEDVPVVVGKTLEMLALVDLLPFTSVAEGEPGGKGAADGIMISHLSYPEVAGCEAGTPVGFSATCMQSFFSLISLASWRQAGGVTVADDLASGAVQAYAQEKFHTYPQGDLALEALMAGNDMLPLIRPWQWQSLQATVDYLAGRYEADPAVKARIDDAARRVLALKSRLYGGLDPAVITTMPDHEGKVGLAQSYDDVASIIERAITLIKPATSEALQKDMPVPNVGDDILFVECWDDPACATPGADPGYPPLWPRGKLADLVGQMFPGRVAKEDLNTISFSDLGAVLAGKGDGAVREAIDGADWLVFGFLELDPNYPASGVLKDFLGRGPTLFDLRSKKIVVFAYNSPYHLDAGELRNVDLFVAAYSKIEPSLRASLKVLFQDPTILRDGGDGGRLPVDYIYEGYVVNDLSESVEADPTQSLAITIEPPQPVAGEQTTISLDSPLLARNGHRVPNGTKVDFLFNRPGGTSQTLAALTNDGLASVRTTFTEPGEVQLTVVSNDLEWSPAEPLGVRGSAAGDESGGAGPVLPLALSLSLLAVAALVAGGVVAVRMRRRRVAVGVAVAEGVPAGDASALPREPPADQELYVDRATQQVFVRGKEVLPPLSREQYALLAFLFENTGKLCLRDDIISRAWPDALGGVSDEAVDALVHRVRERLRAAGASKLFIVTVRGRGFRLDL